MSPLKFQTTVDEAAVSAMPELKPLLGRRVEVVASEASSTTNSGERQRITLDEFLQRRLERPSGVAPVSLEDMERAIVLGALAEDS